MKIADVESKTGLTRANIRYYEAEGLLQPDRLPNGYRDYTDGHVETLRRSSCSDSSACRWRRSRTSSRERRACQTRWESRRTGWRPRHSS